MKKPNPLHRALALAFAAPAMSLLAAEPGDADPKPAAPAQVAQGQVLPAAQAQVLPAAQATSTQEKIEVTAQREHYRGDVPLENLPQAVQVISIETIKEIGAVKLNDILDVATGVARQNTFGGLWDGFAIRGFAGDLNLPSGYLVNGFNARGFGGVRDTSSIEKMEILKGPGSALFGRGDPGGTVSISTLKPQFQTQGSGTLTAGSDQFLRGEGDFTTPINDSVAVRINGAYEDADSFRDTVHTKREFVSPSIFARVGKDTSLWYELEWSHQEIPFDRGVVAARDGSLGIIPVSRYLGEPGDGPTVAKVTGHQAELQHILARNWVLLLGGAYRTTDMNGIGQNPELAAARQPYLQDGQTLSRQRRFTNYSTDDFIGRAEISGAFKTGAVANHLLFGADYEDFQIDRLQTRYRPPVYNGQSLAVMNAVNIFTPVYGNAPAANQNVFNDTEKDKSYGVYLTDQVDLTQAFMLRLGGRYDWFKQHIDNRLATLPPPEQDVTAFSPQVGLSYKAAEGINLYTMYSKGFRPNTGFDVKRNPFEPEISTSYEVGMKYASADGNIVGTIAAFKMKKTNVLTADPVNAGQTIAIGEAESKGIEVDFSATLPGQVTALFSYAYTDAYAGSGVLDPDFARLVAPGDPLINIPKHNGNLLLLKDVDLDGHKLTFGGGVKYVSSRLGETGTHFFLPSYTLVRLLASYQITQKFSVSGEVNNLFDKEYYPSSFAALWVAPGAPRQYQIRTTYHF
ncbi:MAG TPA: TonB-dependent receptor [Usitatibacter sp.]|nr:TonB-dependent receptor [Usitatibacter sp.]